MSISLANAAHGVAMETAPLFYIPSWIKDGHLKMPIFWTTSVNQLFLSQEY